MPETPRLPTNAQPRNSLRPPARPWPPALVSALPRRRVYYDFADMLRTNPSGNVPYTPILPLLYGMEASLKLLSEEGMPNVAARHHRCGGSVLGRSALTFRAATEPRRCSGGGGQARGRAGRQGQAQRRAECGGMPGVVDSPAAACRLHPRMLPSVVKPLPGASVPCMLFRHAGSGSASAGRNPSLPSGLPPRHHAGWQKGAAARWRAGGCRRCAASPAGRATR